MTVTVEEEWEPTLDFEQINIFCFVPNYKVSHEL